jgi:alpha-aminoadipate carrier protein LysW
MVRLLGCTEKVILRQEEAMAICPECEAPLDIEDEQVKEGQVLDCPECGAELEVVSTNPLELDLIENDEGEDDEI